MRRTLLLFLVIVFGSVSGHADGKTDVVQSTDGVSIAYTAYGSGNPAILFIHGGYADQTFWRDQVEKVSGQYRMVTLDLEGNRVLRPDFDAVVMDGCGHYPQLERPAEFNRHLVVYVEELQPRKKS